MRNKIVLFCLVTFWLIFSRGYDLYQTYKFMPALSEEINPLVHYLNLRWTGLIIIISTIIAYTLFAFYHFLFNKANLFPAEKNLTFTEFTYAIYMGKKVKWYVPLYKLPADIKRFHYITGLAFSTGFSIAGIMTTIMWYLINNTSWYYPKYQGIGLLIGFSLCFLPYYLYMKSLYKAYVKAN